MFHHDIPDPEETVTRHIAIETEPNEMSLKPENPTTAL
nr:Putative uncharacterized protein [Moritella viscosa]